MNMDFLSDTGCQRVSMQRSKWMMILNRRKRSWIRVIKRWPRGLRTICDWYFGAVNELCVRLFSWLFTWSCLGITEVPEFQMLFCWRHILRSSGKHECETSKASDFFLKTLASFTYGTWKSWNSNNRKAITKSWFYQILRCGMVMFYGLIEIIQFIRFWKNVKWYLNVQKHSERTRTIDQGLSIILKLSVCDGLTSTVTNGWYTTMEFRDSKVCRLGTTTTDSTRKPMMLSRLSPFDVFFDIPTLMLILSLLSDYVSDQ